MTSLFDLYPKKDWLPDRNNIKNILFRIDKQLRGRNVKPIRENIFSAFDKLSCPPELVIVGQDPYPDDKATGVAFQTEGNRYSLSLKRIAVSLGNDDTQYPDWECWITSFGVLSINVSLTNTGRGRASLAENIKIWKPFTDVVIDHIARNSRRPVVILFGAKTWKYEKKFTAAGVRVSRSYHPAARGKVLGKGIWSVVVSTFGVERFREFRSCTLPMNNALSNPGRI